MFRATQSVESRVVIRSPHVHVTKHQRFVAAARVCRKYLLQQAFRLFIVARHAVRLRKTRKSVERIGAELEAVIVGIDGFLVFTIQPRGISKKKPKLRIVRRSLRCPLGIVKSHGMIAALKSLLRSAGKSRILNVRSPTERLRWLLLVLLLIGRSG